MKRLLLAAILAAALPHLASAEDPIKIGYAISKTGPFAPAAQTQLNAYQLWADKVTADGGIDVGGVKRPVQFVVYDDQSDFGKAPAEVDWAHLPETFRDDNRNVADQMDYKLAAIFRLAR